MAYVDLYNNLYSNPDVEKRMVIACMVAARAVIVESAGTSNHEARLVWARAVLNNPTRVATMMIPAIVTDASFQDFVFTDEELQAAVLGAVNVFAGLV